jgi:transcriptional regulator with XRE-family HTH domain
MPKVYISERQRATESYKRRIKALIKAKMAETGISQGEIAERLGVSQQSISYSLNHGSLSIIQLIQLDGLLKFTEGDIIKLFERRINNV